MSTDLPNPVLFLPKELMSTLKYDSENLNLDLNINNGDIVIYSGIVNVNFLESYVDLVNDNNVQGADNSKYLIEDYTVHPLKKTGHVTFKEVQTIITSNCRLENPVYYSTVESIPDSETQFLFDPTSVESAIESTILSISPQHGFNENIVLHQNDNKYLDWQPSNTALEQLMSADEKGTPKQRKTIMFSGLDASCGQTVHKIDVHDPSLQCTNSGTGQYELLKVSEDRTPKNKKYQCETCQQIFDHITLFKQHMVAKHRPVLRKKTRTEESDKPLMCISCNKTFKSEDKMLHHLQGHGNSDRECKVCHRVLSSKSSLKNHAKTHYRRHGCKFCTKSFNKKIGLELHLAKCHRSNVCNECNLVCNDENELQEHLVVHLPDSNISELDLGDDFTSFVNEALKNPSIINKSINEGYLFEDGMEVDNEETVVDDFVKEETVIGKVVSNTSTPIKETPRGTERRIYKHKHNKICRECGKRFDRSGDLKRHLIEHIIRRTLSQNPVSQDGKLKLECEICFKETFSEIDKYKAHLRAHAQLTIYECTFCDKTFSDSSNFSKHKKVHSKSFFQCDLCHRKFNSKKMIARHMDYHKVTPPLPCQYCDRVYHFESTFKKHMRFSHARVPPTKYRCKVCEDYFVSLKDKWDHEWTKHKIRKMVIDCDLCSSKFRKFTDLKRHCLAAHGTSLASSKSYFTGLNDSFFEVDSTVDL